MNPFKLGVNIDTKGSNGNYRKHVKAQILTMSIGDSAEADIGWKEKSDFRMNMGQIAREVGMKFKTATGEDGLLYIKRIK